jgi:hypothetical protein
MTDISVSTVSYQVEKRSWLLSEHGTRPGENPGITLEPALFTAGTHYPNGYLPSGTAISPAGGPYSGTGACAGLLFSSVRFPNGTTKVGGALVRMGVVKTGKLPFSSGTGSLGAGGVAALPLIDFTNDGT